MLVITGELTEQKMAETRHASVQAREGLLYGLAAQGLWGLAPLYFRELDAVPPVEILFHRIVWSGLFALLLIALAGRWKDLRDCFGSRPILTRLLISTLLLAVNWLVYIYSVATNRILQASLGYYLTPLVNVLLGMVCFGERLRAAQWLAVALGTAGVLIQMAGLGHLPWIALCVAGSFGFYGMIRKGVPVDGLLGLTVETLLLVPISVAFILWGLWTQEAAALHLDARASTFLYLSGVVTAVPLLCFGQAARRLRLTTLGILQYLAPSMQFLLAVLLYGEKFTTAHAISFGCIWTALLLYTTDSLLVYRRSLVRSS
jgi:chloramphenicol-sensitive protein RarD